VDPCKTSTFTDDDCRKDEDTGNNKLMTDLSISHPAAPSSNAPAGWLSTIPLYSSSTSTSIKGEAAQTKVPSRGFSFEAGMDLESGSSQLVISNASMDEDEEQDPFSQGKGKDRENKRRASETEHNCDKDDEPQNESQRFKHFKQTQHTGKQSFHAI
jgi:hypothetical protein